MDIEIPEKVKDATRACFKGFSCLSNNACNTCDVAYDLQRNVLMLKSCSEDYCPYHELWGTKHVCLCPTRYELFTKHGV